jgi:hypothetical protein
MTAALILAGVLETLGIGLIWRETQVFRGIQRAPDEDADFLRNRTRRRLRIGLVICLLGVLMGVGGWVAPRERPVVFLAAWSAALLATLWLLWLAAADLFTVRFHWNERTRNNLADIARTKSELKRFQGPAENNLPRGGGL